VAVFVEETPSEAVTAYVGLGANLQDPRAQLVRALHSLAAMAEPGSLQRSGLYRSAPLGPPGQPDYLNAAVRFATRASPRALLQSLQALERDHGRERGVRWGARTLDLDILLYARAIISEANLRIPHLAIPVRLFVLQPLHDLDPELQVPGMGTVNEMLDQCPAWRLEPVAWEL